MKETEIVALEQSMTLQKSKIIQLSGYVATSIDHLANAKVTELPEKLEKTSQEKIKKDDEVRSLQEILANQASKRLMNTVEEEKKHLVLTKRYNNTFLIRLVLTLP